MSRHPTRVDAFDFLITTLLAVLVVLAAFSLASAFQTIPTATAPLHSEVTYER